MEAQNILDINKIKYAVNAGIIVAMIEQSESNNAAIMQLIDMSIPCIISKKFSENELWEAEWLVVRPAWNQYYAENIKKTFSFPCTKCEAGRFQIHNIQIKDNFQKWKKSFLGIGGVDELFTNDEGRLALSDSGLKGFTFKEIYCLKTKTQKNNMYQIYIQNVLPRARVDSLVEFSSRTKCPVCGQEHVVLMPQSPFVLYRKAFCQIESDIVKTSEYYGESMAAQRILISRQFYRFLVNKKLDGSMVFDDIVTLA